MAEQPDYLLLNLFGHFGWKGAAPFEIQFFQHFHVCETNKSICNLCEIVMQISSTGSHVDGKIISMEIN